MKMMNRQRIGMDTFQASTCMQQADLIKASSESMIQVDDIH